MVLNLYDSVCICIRGESELTVYDIVGHRCEQRSVFLNCIQNEFEHFSGGFQRHALWSEVYVCPGRSWVCFCTQFNTHDLSHTSLYAA